MKASLEKRFEDALISSKLEQLVLALTDEGRQQIEIYALFENFRSKLRAERREDDEDKVMDMMDRITGWCSSHQRFFDHYLSNEEIDAYITKTDKPGNG